MALGQLAAGDHPEHLLGQLEQAQPVRDRGLGAADPVGDVSERELELVDERGVRTRLLDRRELLAGDVLDQGEKERVAVVGLAHERGQRRESGFARGAPATFAGDQLIAARLPRPNDDGLQQTLLLDRACEPGGRLGLEAPPRLPRIRVDRVDRQLASSSGPFGAADQDLETTAETAAWLGSRSTSSIATFQYASAPVERRSYAIAGRPWLGASARRTERGTVVVKTRSPKCRRTSASTSAASRVRPSTIVIRIPANPSLRVQPGLDELDRAEQLREPLERVVLGLHRHDHPVGGGERIDGQRAERRRTVEEDEAVALTRAGERALQVALPVLVARELDRHAGEVVLGGDELEIPEAGRPRDLRDRRTVEQVVARDAVRVLAEPRGGVRLWVEVDEQRPLARLRKAGRKVEAVVVLPTPPFWFASAMILPATRRV